jgi:thermitase
MFKSRQLSIALTLATTLMMLGCGHPSTLGVQAGPRVTAWQNDEPETLPEGAEPDEATLKTAPAGVVPDQLIVAVKPGVRAVLAAPDSEIKTIKTLSLGTQFQVVQIPAGMSRDEAIARLKRQPGVDTVHPNRIYGVNLTPNDVKFVDQWGMRKDRMNAPAAWEKGVNASNITVAVLDTGVDYNHPELKGRVIVGPDLADKDNDPMDVHGHGTHVAGIVGASGNNSEGIAGVAWNCKILAVKVLGDKGNGTSDSVAEGIKYAADHGAKVINLSLGTDQLDIDAYLHAAMEYAFKKGTLVVAAAGNAGGQVGSPANDPYAIAVSSTSNFWKLEWLSFFSNRGDKIEVAAPGGGIWSLLPTRESNIGRSQGRTTYGKLSGTSMACPYVSGEAALIFAQHPNWTPDQVRARIRNAVDDRGAAGKDAKYGYGRINLAKALD